MGSLGEWNKMESEKIQRDQNIYSQNEDDEEDDGQMLDLELEGEDEEISDQQQIHSEGKNSISQQQQYVCEYESCKKVFRAKKSLRDHLRIHTNQRPYHCREQNCGKSFVQYSSLQKHLRIHKGDRPYKCTVEGCEQAFTQVSNLNRHLSLHQNLKPYICDICQRTFATTSNLHQHKITHETSSERARFICEIDSCGKSYLYQSSLKKHEKEHILNNLQQTLQKQQQQQSINDINESQVIHGINLPNVPQATHNNAHDVHNYHLIDNNNNNNNNHMFNSNITNNGNSLGKVNDWQSNLHFQQQMVSLPQHHHIDLNQNEYRVEHQILENHSLKSANNQDPQLSFAANAIHSNNYGDNKAHNLLSGHNTKIPNEDSDSMTALKENKTQEMPFLSSFFDNSHVALQHGDHYDILFKGYLYNYNKKTGKVEIHDIEIHDEVQKGTCQPLSEMSHNSNEEMHKKLSEIEYRYNDASIFTSACSSLSCKCALNPDRSCCQGAQSEGETDQLSVSTQCCCADKEKEAVKKEMLLEKQESMKQENGKKGCCKGKTNGDMVKEKKDEGNCCKKDKNEKQDHKIQENKVEERGKCCGGGGNAKKQEKNSDGSLNQMKNQDQKSTGCCCKGKEISQEKTSCACCSSDKQIEKKPPLEKSGCCSKKNTNEKQEIQNLITNQSSCCSKSQSACSGADTIKQECICTDCGDNCSTDCKNCNSENSEKQDQEELLQTQMKMKKQQLEQEILAQQQKYQQQTASSDPVMQRCICQETKDLKHVHGANCGHLAVFHNGHLDYIVDNKLHHPHGTHCDYHGIVEVLENTVSI